MRANVCIITCQKKKRTLLEEGWQFKQQKNPQSFGKIVMRSVYCGKIEFICLFFCFQGFCLSQMWLWFHWGDDRRLQVRLLSETYSLGYKHALKNVSKSIYRSLWRQVWKVGRLLLVAFILRLNLNFVWYSSLLSDSTSSTSDNSDSLFSEVMHVLTNSILIKTLPFLWGFVWHVASLVFLPVVAAAVYGALRSALAPALLRVGPKRQRAGTCGPELPFSGVPGHCRGPRARVSFSGRTRAVVQAWTKACSGRVCRHGAQKPSKWFNIPALFLFIVLSCTIYQYMGVNDDKQCKQPPTYSLNIWTGVFMQTFMIVCEKIQQINFFTNRWVCASLKAITYTWDWFALN